MSVIKTNMEPRFKDFGFPPARYSTVRMGQYLNKHISQVEIHEKYGNSKKIYWIN
jgi:hypothetical protein